MSDPGQPKRTPHSTLGAPEATVRMARRLRKEMSFPEVLLWQQLKQHPGGYQFRKQHPLGQYALDFACIRARLAIEVDGEAHDRGDHPARDAVRDDWVMKQGLLTIRFPAVDLLTNMEGVIVAIVEACKGRARPNPPQPVPAKAGREVARSDGGAALGDARTREVRAWPHPAPPTPAGPPPSPPSRGQAGEDFQ